MRAYERENIKRMSGYTPGEQSEKKDLVKLNTNENPYPPSREVLDELYSIGSEDLRRYPSSTAINFRQVAAEVHGVKSENVIATNGGDELLRLAITTFIDPGQALGVAEPSYSLYSVLAEIQDCSLVCVNLNDGWEIPRGFSERLNDASAKMAILVNPHAPSGKLTEVQMLAKIAEEFGGVLLIDEAYVDFVDPELEYNAIELINRYDNVLILRTLSKGYSLAGLRFGYGIGSETLIEPMLSKTKDSYNVNSISQRLAIAALKSRDKAAESWIAVRNERKRLLSRLGELGMDCPSSQSNFVLATVPDGLSVGAREIYMLLKKNNIYIRYFDHDRLRDKLRITIGTPEQNERLLKILGELIKGKGL